MTKEERLNALHAIARRCNEELKQIPNNDTRQLRAIIDSHMPTVELLKFSKIELQVTIGRLNGQLSER